MNGWQIFMPLMAAGALTVAADAAQTATNPKTEALIGQLTQQIDASEKASPELKVFVKQHLLPLCTNPVFVQQVKAQNAKQRPLAEIQKIDQEWVQAEDELPIHREVMDNACAREIRKITAQVRVIGETFVMDNQGANVGQNELTSDYWQGDEPKWQNAYAKGKGGVEFGKPKLDKSTNTVDQKISLPIFDEQGMVIGAVCFGVNPDQGALAAVTDGS